MINLLENKFKLFIVILTTLVVSGVMYVIIHDYPELALVAFVALIFSALWRIADVV